MKKTKTTLRPALINDKDILSDFTNRFHDECCVIRKSDDGHIIEYFVINDCLCYVSYVYNTHRFKTGVVEGSLNKISRCKYILKELSLSFESNDGIHHLKVVEESPDSYAFYMEIEPEPEPEPEEEYYFVIPII